MKKLFLTGIISILIFSAEAQISFEEQATNLGLGTSCGTTYLGNGVTFYDFDNDGWDDITLSKENGQSISFYKNVNGSFQELTMNIPAFTHQTKQINWLDFDNDGDKDLFITSDTDGNMLLEQTGNFDFQDITLASGISTSNMFTYGSSWGDINNDGFLDLFISNRTNTTPNILYKNNGNGTFTDVSVLAGIDQTAVASFCSAFFDLNNDGFQDIYVSNDKPQNPNKLYKNNGDGTFTDISVSSGTNVGIDAMSVTIGDFNNDSWFDIYITNNPDGNVLYKNNGNETFTDIAQPSGTIFNSVGWGASFFDADNDMDLDLYVCGMFDATNTTFLKGAFYDNNGDETFTLNNSCFPGDDRASFSSAIGDANNDGLPEMVVTNNNDENIFAWQNNTTTSNNWLKVKLEGTTSNKDGIGSVIEMSVNGSSYYRYMLCGEGYLSQNSGTEIFGLGSNLKAEYLKVTWLSGSVDIFYDVNANQVLNIVEGSSPLSTEGHILKEINIYPNPVVNILKIESNEQLEIELYDVLGRKQKIKYLENSESIDVSFLMNGLYFLKLKKDKEKSIYKIIKQ